MDAHTIDFKEFKNSRANITTLRLMDPTSMEVTSALHDWKKLESRYNKQLYITAERISVRI